MKSWLNIRLLINTSGLVIAIYSVFYIFSHEKVFDSPDNVYEKAIPKELLKEFNHIKFVEASDELNINHEHIGKKGQHMKFVDNIPNKKRIVNKYKQFLFSKVKKNFYKQKQPHGREPAIIKFVLPNTPFLFPSVSIVDIDNDGYSDIFLPQTKSNKNQLLRNDNGNGFVDVSDVYSLGSINDNKHTSMAYFVDFNLDGFTDVLITRWGCHDLYFGQGPNKRFIKKSGNLDGYCSFPRGVNFIDFNKDGILDIVFGNYVNLRDLEKFSWDMQGIFAGNKIGGAENIVLQGLPGGRFKQRKDLNFNGWRSFTHSVGIFDFNDDGWPDIFFTNDYSSDEVWINNKGKGFSEATNQYFPIYRHGFTGMNSEVFDLDNDGFFEVYITNTYKPPYKSSLNNLWKRRGTNKAFEQVSDEMNIGRCGFAWSAKFADIDNNGASELFVVNGRSNSFGNGVRYDSYWYYFHELTLIPRFLRPYRKRRLLNFGNYSSDERNCLFAKYKSKYYDIAHHVGITDILDGRGASITDFENDGKVDYVVANILGKTLAYNNKSTIQGNWLGLRFNNKTLKESIHGLKVTVELSDGSKMYRLYNPFHGYRSQSDPRLHFGLGNRMVNKIIVKLTSGRTIKINNVKINSYNQINI